MGDLDDRAGTLIATRKNSRNSRSSPVSPTPRTSQISLRRLADRPGVAAGISGRSPLVARRFALAAAIAASLLAVSGASGADAQTPKRGGTLVIRVLGPQPACLNVLAESCIPQGLLSWIDEVLQKPYEVVPTTRTRNASSRGSTT